MSDALGQTRVSDALSDLVTAGTPDDVRRRYASLAGLAREATLSLAESPVIVCDTETTGTDANRDVLIEIAAVRLSGADAVAEFHTFVDPGRHIPDDITELTGISDSDVHGAPSPADAVRAFSEFAGTDDLVAHNATFDRGFVEAAAESPCDAPKGRWIDTLALSQIVLPRLKNHKLASLARAFGLDAPSHRAGDDVRALAGLWRVLLAGAQTMEPGLAAAIEAISPETDWALREIFAEAAGAHPGVEFTLRNSRAARIGDSTRAARRDCAEDELSFATDAEIDAAFGEGGLLEKMYDGYEPREPQRQMALEVNSALREERAAALEAGTGVGKSMAYLVPLALAAKRNKVVMGVATKTNALTDQLVYHELPRLADALGGLDYVTLKGYDHYPCLRKLERAVREASDEPAGDVERLAALVSFAAETHWGDLDSLNMSLPSFLRSRVTANASDCLKSHCPFHPRLCLLHGARRAANAADIVVTNHALLFCDAQADGGILPPVRHWIIDEAHGAESEARRQLSLDCTAIDYANLLRRLAGPHSSIIASLRRKAGKAAGGSILMGPLADMENRAQEVDGAQTVFFELVKRLLDAECAAGEKAAGYDRVELWASPALRESPEWEAMAASGRVLAEKTEGLVRRINDVVMLCEQFEATLSAQQADLANVSSDLRSQEEALMAVLDGTDDSYVFSAELDRRPSRHVEALHAQKLDIGAALVEMFYPEVRSVVFTSATLSTGGGRSVGDAGAGGAAGPEDGGGAAGRERGAAAGGDAYGATGVTGPFEHFAHGVGIDLIDPGKVTCRQLMSAYDFDGHMGVLLPTDLAHSESGADIDALGDFLCDVHIAMGGSVLTLFTNRRDMETLYRRLKPRLQEVSLDLAAQQRGTSAAQLRERFIDEESLSLFALKSFWEGFDAPGDTLRCVIIVKLPFAKPTDPLSCERRARERQSWTRYTLPESIIEVKQAAGRLIRTSTDEGWLILCDERVRTKGYGKKFLAALPTGDVRELTCSEISEVLREGR